MRQLAACKALARNGGRDLPKELALKLPLIFAETFGVWAARVPRSHVEAIFGL